MKSSLGSTHQWNRYAFFAAAIPALALTWMACSSSSSAPPPPPPGDAGPACPTDNCPNGQQCCAGVDDAGGPSLSCQTSCSGSSDLQCTTGSQCTGTANLCCANVASISDPNSATACSVTGVSSRCESACTGSYGVSNCNPSITKLCQTSSDCGGTLGEEAGVDGGPGSDGFTQCCDLVVSGAALRICVPPGSAQDVNCH